MKIQISGDPQAVTELSELVRNSPEGQEVSFSGLTSARPSLLQRRPLGSIEWTTIIVDVATDVAAAAIYAMLVLAAKKYRGRIAIETPTPETPASSSETVEGQVVAQNQPETPAEPDSAQ